MTTSFYLIATTKLEELLVNAEITVKKSLFGKKVTDNYWNYLAGNAAELPNFDGPGYIYGNLLVYLEEQKNIDLTTNEYGLIAKELIEKRGNAHFLFTNTQRLRFSDQLDPGRYSLAEVQQFNKDFSEEGDVETAVLTVDAIRVLRNNLNKVENNQQLLLLVIG